MSGLRGGLDLVAGVDSAGRTILRKQAFSPPIHISKPHEDAGWLVVNLASPSPGLLAGDRVHCNVRVEQGARLTLTAPSANRIHAMPEGHAELAQTFRVEAGAALDVWPEYLIPQGGARYRQRTVIELEEEATLLWTEMIAPGRAARGEVFAFGELFLAMDLRHGDRLLARERYQLTPERLASVRRLFATPYYASIICAGPLLASGTAALAGIATQGDVKQSWIGATQIEPGAWAIKIVAADSPTLRSRVAEIRAQLFAALGCRPANLRRTSADVMGSNSLARCSA